MTAAPTERELAEQQIIDAIADGALQTEGSLAALREQLQAGAAESTLDELLTYVETLERAVLASWDHSENDGFDHYCGHCCAALGIDEHSPDCIVPALIAKYEGV